MYKIQAYEGLTELRPQIFGSTSTFFLIRLLLTHRLLDVKVRLKTIIKAKLKKLVRQTDIISEHIKSWRKNAK